MCNPTIKILRECPGITPFPEYAHSTDSGADLFSIEDYWLAPGETRAFKTGIRIQLPPGYEVQLRPKSGLTVKHSIFGIFGTIDEGYTGEILVMLHNASPVRYRVKPQQKIAQLVVVPYIQARFVEVMSPSDFTLTDRGSKGFGSTGMEAHHG